MEPFTQLTAVAAPIDLKNVNTDMIFPARFLRKPRDAQYKTYLFHDQKFRPDGTEHPEFMLNKPLYRNAEILVGNTNFGCGSSRETAVYALHDYGIRALIAPSFGDIFAANCIKNGLLPIRLDEEVCTDLRALTSAQPGIKLTIDLVQQQLEVPGKKVIVFGVEPFERECLLKGLDDVDVTLCNEEEMTAFDIDYRREFPWLFRR